MKETLDRIKSVITYPEEGQRQADFCIVTKDKVYTLDEREGPSIVLYDYLPEDKISQLEEHLPLIHIADRKLSHFNFLKDNLVDSLKEVKVYRDGQEEESSKEVFTDTNTPPKVTAEVLNDIRLFLNQVTGKMLTQASALTGDTDSLSDKRVNEYLKDKLVSGEIKLKTTTHVAIDTFNEIYVYEEGCKFYYLFNSEEFIFYMLDNLDTLHFENVSSLEIILDKIVLGGAEDECRTECSKVRTIVDLSPSYTLKGVMLTPHGIKVTSKNSPRYSFSPLQVSEPFRKLLVDLVPDVIDLGDSVKEYSVTLLKRPEDSQGFYLESAGPTKVSSEKVGDIREVVRSIDSSLSELRLQDDYVSSNYSHIVEAISNENKVFSVWIFREGYLV